MDANIAMIREKNKAQHQQHSLSNTKLDKMFRLYAPDRVIRNNYVSPQKNVKQTQKSVIQLVFPHPNLLFIHPQKIKDPAQKHAFMQLKMIKNIVERKGLNTAMKSARYHQKSMTAPNIGRNKTRMMNRNSMNRIEQQDVINICNLGCEKQNLNIETFSSTFYTHKPKAFTTKSRHGKNTPIVKENHEQSNEKQFQYELLNRNTFDFKMEEKLKAIQSKYKQDKLMRQNMYKSIQKSPKTAIYIKMEGKFTKYFKQS